jgi:DNA-binding NtrC family response regulator
VILASSVSDHYLFEELIHQGGYDVIAKPLKLEELRRITRLALTFWKNRAIRRG